MTESGTRTGAGLSALCGPERAASQELQSALVRLGLWLAMVIALGIGGASGHFSLDWSLYGWLFGVHFIWFAGLLLHVLHAPGLNPQRTYVAVAADLSATTLLIYLSGELLAPFYLVYILSFLSQGTRYGPTNLAIASIGSILSYGLVATLMNGWAAHTFEVAFILVALTVLPLYQYSLLRNLQRERRSAEIANKARGDFLATMSHELRTPLTGVVGMARLLEGTDLDDEQRRCVDSICASGDTLHALIGDILDLSKVDAGGLELHVASFDLRQSLLDVCRNLGQHALEKEVELVCCIDGSLPVTVRGDRVRFEQILYNLIGNAVKFTPAGRVCVEAERSRPHPELRMDHLEVVIGDTGIGIPRERLDCIFESFWQADTTTSRRYGGTGLGTTIAHRLVEAMGGHISADSEENQGTTFRVRLPFLPAAEDDRPPQPPPSLAGCTTLIFETDPESRSALDESCRQAGMQVLSCSDDDELARQLAAAESDLSIDFTIIADAPSGLDLDAVRETLCARLGHVPPTVYVTYGGRPRNTAGPGSVTVGKPWHPVELWRALERARDPGAQAAPAPPSAGLQQPRAHTARILVVEDDRINAALVETLLSRWGYSAEVVRDAESALALTEPFDLLLVDLRMPGMDGVEFTRRLRARETRGSRVPVVALTAHADEDSRRRGFQAGIDHFLTKPIDPEALGTLLERLADAQPA